MTASRIFRIVVHLCRFGLAALFLFTAGAKLWILKNFRRPSVAELPQRVAQSMTERWPWPVTIGVMH
jgi:hypothetical protein